jgi:hypothetical protein
LGRWANDASTAPCYSRFVDDVESKLASDQAPRRFDSLQPACAPIRERGDVVELLVPMLVGLVLLLMGMLAPFFGADSRASIKDTRKKWW